MATSPSSEQAAGRDDAQAPELSISTSATPAEAAAIASAVAAHLRARRRATAVGKDGEAMQWDGRRWAFAGRTEAVSGRPLRTPSDAPTNEWTTLGRLEGLTR